jgi:hypothetical protein
MLIPQFSIRSVLVVMTALSLFSLIASLALRGQVWAMAVVIAGVHLALTFLLYGLCFFAAWCVCQLRGRSAGAELTPSVLAQDRLPPQVIPPEEPPT